MRDRNTDDITKIRWESPDQDPPLFADGEVPISAADLTADGATYAGGDDRSLADKSSDNKMVGFHYPQPTPLREVLQAVAKWSDLNFVMDPGLNNRPIQIFAPRKLFKEDAFQLFVASLETIGLRALHLQGKVVKIVPATPSKFAV